MNRVYAIPGVWALFAWLAAASAAAHESETAFTVQAQLIQDGTPVDGSADVLVYLFDAAAEGNQIGDPVRVTDVRVGRGLMNFMLDFGDEPFSAGEPRWLEVHVRVPHDPNDRQPFVPLQQRLCIGRAPYAMRANTSGDLSTPVTLQFGDDSGEGRSTLSVVATGQNPALNVRGTDPNSTFPLVVYQWDGFGSALRAIALTPGATGLEVTMADPNDAAFDTNASARVGGRLAVGPVDPNLAHRADIVVQQTIRDRIAIAIDALPAEQQAARIGVVEGQRFELGHIDRGTGTFKVRIGLDPDGGLFIPEVAKLGGSDISIGEDQSGNAAFRFDVSGMSLNGGDGGVITLKARATDPLSFQTSSAGTHISGGAGGAVRLSLDPNDPESVFLLGDATGTRISGGSGGHLSLSARDAGGAGIELAGTDVSLSAASGGSVSIATPGPGAIRIGDADDTVISSGTLQLTGALTDSSGSPGTAGQVLTSQGGGFVVWAEPQGGAVDPDPSFNSIGVATTARFGPDPNHPTARIDGATGDAHFHDVGIVKMNSEIMTTVEGVVGKLVCDSITTSDADVTRLGVALRFALGSDPNNPTARIDGATGDARFNNGDFAGNVIAGTSMSTPQISGTVGLVLLAAGNDPNSLFLAGGGAGGTRITGGSAGAVTIGQSGDAARIAAATCTVDGTLAVSGRLADNQGNTGQPGDVLTVDPNTGALFWLAPQAAGGSPDPNFNSLSVATTARFGADPNNPTARIDGATGDARFGNIAVGDKLSSDSITTRAVTITASVQSMDATLFGPDPNNPTARIDGATGEARFGKLEVGGDLTVAGTLTAGSLSDPNGSTGAARQVLTADGGGRYSWQDAPGGGSADPNFDFLIVRGNSTLGDDPNDVLTVSGTLTVSGSLSIGDPNNADIQVIPGSGTTLNSPLFAQGFFNFVQNVVTDRLQISEGTISSPAVQVTGSSPSVPTAIFRNFEMGGTAIATTGDLRVEGNLEATGDICARGSVGNCSDARLKTNVEDLGGALELVRRLRGVRFLWRHDEFPERRLPEGRQIGFIAQELAEVLPEVVVSDRDGYYAVDYAKTTAVLAEAVKELDARLAQHEARMESQQRRLDDQQKQIARLSERLARLEALLTSGAPAAAR